MSVSQKANVKNGTIELWRLVFSVVIVFCHLEPILGSGETWLFKSGAICVEFFFVVSGYLMAQSVHKAPPLTPGSLGKDTLAFMRRKVRALCPNYYIAWGIGFIVYLTANDLWNFTGFFKTLFRCIYELSFVTLSGLIHMRINGAVWYISAMLLVMLLIYPLLRKHYEFFTSVTAPLTAVFVLGYLMKNFGDLRTGTQWLGLTYKGNLRALAELCLGISLFPLSQRLRKLELTGLSRGLLTAAEVFGYFALLYCAALPKATKYDFLFLFFVSVSVCISFSGQSLFYNVLNNRFSLWCGSYSLSLYLSHVFYAKQLPLLLPGWETERLFVLYWLSSLSTGLFVMYASRFLKAHSASIRQRLRPLFLKEPE